jgi:cold shock CspA family protein
MAVRKTGTIRWIGERRVYGFIDCETGQEVFFHISAIKDPGNRALCVGDRVEFKLEQDRTGSRATELVVLS